MDAAARVFAQRGLQGSSVEEITAEAGYSRGAFYSNFTSKEQLFVELLLEHVYTRYNALVQAAMNDPDRVPTLRQLGERLGDIQADIQEEDEDRLLFRLWLECLAQAGRDEKLRELAATFWRENRVRTAALIERASPHHAERAKAISSAIIALDIGLAIQHVVDPDEAPLDLYPELYSLLFESLLTP